MTIYIDLDETLIHAAYAKSGNPGKRTPIRLSGGKEDKDEVYYTLLRPKALELLDFCRSLAKVNMLTTATADYALKHNDVFTLGFRPNEIIARENYLTYSTLAYGSCSQVTQLRVDPTSILIDNLPRIAEQAMLKQRYLGIQPAQYIQIREFSGKDPTKFEHELIQIKTTIKNIVLKTKEPATTCQMEVDL